MKNDKLEFTIHSLAAAQKWNDSWDGWIVVVDAQTAEKKSLNEALGFLDRPSREACLAFASRFEFKAKAGDILSFDLSTSQRVVLAAVANTAEVFDLLCIARDAWEPLFGSKAKAVGIDLRGAAPGSLLENLCDAFTSAYVARRFEPPKFTASTDSDKRKPGSTKLHFCLDNRVDPEPCRSRIRQADGVTHATNFVRYLSLLPPDALSPSAYVKRMKDQAREASLQWVHHDEKALLKRKAGAFLAVTRGAEDHGGGIVCIRYSPKGKKRARRIALVGKGITFDTGGHNLKTDGHMLGMHMDMAGSAVAAALVYLAKENNWPVEVEAYLAIAENSIGPKAYRPNEVVRASNGKTIEIIDTDAEGRMVLSDTLWLAAESKPDLILDFATLTGSCIRAIGKNFSGTYSNQRDWVETLIRAGRDSGERVWPFPLDADFGKALKSDIADIKQCRPSGGVDHIEAAYFLSQFVPENIPWVHTDLSAIENDEGLAHVPPKVTGFGVRFASRLMQQVAKAHWGLNF
jgi:leucyl aminopeptidase